MKGKNVKDMPFYVFDENGDAGETDIKGFSKYIVSLCEEGNVTIQPHGDKSAADTVGSLVVFAAQGRELQDDVLEVYGDVFEIITDKLSDSNDHLQELRDKEKSEKEKKKEEREAAKKAAEQEKAEIKETQETFLKSVETGATVAAKEFTKELETFQKGKALPDSVKIVPTEHQGFALDIADNASTEDLGKAAGIFMQKAANSEYMKNSNGFLLGAVCNRLNKDKAFTKSGAAKFLATSLAEQAKAEGSERKTIGYKGIEAFARMEEQIKPEFRNSRVDESYYLQLSNMPKIKPKDGESEEDFAERQLGYAKDKKEIASGLANEQYGSLKDVKAKVSEILVNRGVREAKDPDALTKADYLNRFFIITRLLNDFIGDKDGIEFQSKGEKITLEKSKAELLEELEEASNNLDHMLLEYDYGKQPITVESLIAGEAEVDEDVLDDKGKKTGKTKKVKKNFYLRPYWKVEKAEAPAEEESTEEADPFAGGEEEEAEATAEA